MTCRIFTLKLLFVLQPYNISFLWIDSTKLKNSANGSWYPSFMTEYTIQLKDSETWKNSVIMMLWIYINERFKRKIMETCIKLISELIYLFKKKYFLLFIVSHKVLTVKKNKNTIYKIDFLTSPTDGNVFNIFTIFLLNKFWKGVPKKKK